MRVYNFYQNQIIVIITMDLDKGLNPFRWLDFVAYFQVLGKGIYLLSSCLTFNGFNFMVFRFTYGHVVYIAEKIN